MATSAMPVCPSRLALPLAAVRAKHSNALIQSCLPRLTGKKQRVAGGHFLSKMALIDLAAADPVRRIEVLSDPAREAKLTPGSLRQSFSNVEGGRAKQTVHCSLIVNTMAFYCLPQRTWALIDCEATKKIVDQSLSPRAHC